MSLNQIIRILSPVYFFCIRPLIVKAVNDPNETWDEELLSAIDDLIRNLARLNLESN